MVDSKPLFTGEEWDDIYALPPTALKVWLFHYRCEINGRESWPGEDLICHKLCICRDTLADNRKWLKDHGWLVQTSPAYRGHNPTFRVERGWIPDSKSTDDPLTKISGNEVGIDKASQKSRRIDIPKQRKNSDAFNASVKMRRKNTDAKVSSSSSVSVSVLSSPSVKGLSYPDRQGSEQMVTNRPDGQEKGETDTKTKTPRKTVAPDGTPWSEWDKHDAEWKAHKLEELKPKPLCQSLLDDGTPCPEVGTKRKTRKTNTRNPNSKLEVYTLCEHHAYEWDEREMDHLEDEMLASTASL